MIQEINNKVFITCWNCNKRMSQAQHLREDGFCPHCEAEVNTSGEPYVDEEPEKT